jgi:hypothetical protein
MTTRGEDNFYYHEILKDPDKKQFIQAMKEEIANHNQNHNWKPVLQSTLPSDTKFIPSVWAMRRRRRLMDGTIYKWKSRLNVDGSKQVYRINFWETYAPVAQRISIRLIMCMASINKWKIKTFDSVQAFHQAPSEAELFIDLPKGCQIGEDNSQWCLQVINNIYGQKQAGQV